MTGCQSGCRSSHRTPAPAAYRPPPWARAEPVAPSIRKAMRAIAPTAGIFSSRIRRFRRNRAYSHGREGFHEMFLEFSWTYEPEQRKFNKPNFIRKFRYKPLTLKEVGCGQVPQKIRRTAYFTAMAPTRDSKILNPSVPPSSGSLERSGCGIIPSTFRPGLQIPAMLSRDPLGLDSGVISPEGEQ